MINFVCVEGNTTPVGKEEVTPPGEKCFNIGTFRKIDF